MAKLSRHQAALLATRDGANKLKIPVRPMLDPGRRPTTRAELHAGTWVRGPDGKLVWTQPT